MRFGAYALEFDGLQNDFKVKYENAFVKFGESSVRVFFVSEISAGYEGTKHVGSGAGFQLARA